MSRLPDWLHPWRWYAATVIIEALYRYLIKGESAREIGLRFGRQGDHYDWPSLRRWRSQLLASPTLWGWLGKRLGVVSAAKNEGEGRTHLMRLFAEMNLKLEAMGESIGELCTAVRGSLRGLVHNRRTAWPVVQFRPGQAGGGDSGPAPMASPTEKDAGPGPPA